MRDFAPCFSENAIQIADYSQSKPHKSPQNSITRVYQSQIRSKSCLISVTWSKNLIGQILTVGIDDSFVECLCKLDFKPWPFSRKRGYKTTQANSCKIDIHWDLSSAKFKSSPEPSSGFYVGIVIDRRMILLLGDLQQEALKKTNSKPASPNAILVAKTEHIFGKNTFCTRSQFCDNDRFHDLVIECNESAIDDSRSLRIRIDGKVMVQVKQLQWKFRGNCSILIGRIPVEVCWDVHNWLFGTCLGDAVFLFRTFSSVNQECGRRSLRENEQQQQQPWGFSQRFSELKSENLGFSLILHAWKSE